jgi:hypothetical protein
LECSKSSTVEKLAVNLLNTPGGKTTRRVGFMNLIWTVVDEELQCIQGRIKK